jgi:hypothetical protein
VEVGFVVPSIPPPCTALLERHIARHDEMLAHRVIDMVSLRPFLVSNEDAWCGMIGELMESRTQLLGMCDASEGAQVLDIGFLPC